MNLKINDRVHHCEDTALLGTIVNGPITQHEMTVYLVKWDDEEAIEGHFPSVLVKTN